MYITVVVGGESRTWWVGERANAAKVPSGGESRD